MKIAQDPSRAVLAVSGEDAGSFLQGLLTNDVERAGPEEAVYAALLTPQGKFLFDALVLRPTPERFLLEAAADSVDAFAKRLSLYKLRAKVAIAPRPEMSTFLVWDAETAAEAAPLEATAETPVFRDPRAEALGWRVLTADALETRQRIGAAAQDVGLDAYHRLRVSLGVPLAGAELRSGETFPLEADFERVHGVDFKKGCYVGQEVTARMRHKAVLKKGLKRVRFEGAAPEPGAEVFADGKPAGIFGAAAGDEALAVLRLDRIGYGALRAGDAALTVLEDGADGAS